MKKIISLFLTMALAISSMICVSAANEEIKVYLEENKIAFDVPPQTINNRTMVPIRAIFEAMGATVTWDDVAKVATAEKSGKIVQMVLNSTTMLVNGEPSSMDVAPVIVNGRTLAPARYVAEAFGYEVNWNENTRTVSITPAKSVENAFEKLKSIIISKGKKNSEKSRYEIVKYENGNDSSYDYYYFYIYDCEKDTVYLYLGTKGGYNNNRLIISFKPQKAPIFMFILEYGDGVYNFDNRIYGGFSDISGALHITEYENLDEAELRNLATKLLYATIGLLDADLKVDLNVSFDSLGLYYPDV